MLHVILKASGRLLRPEGIAEFRTAVESINTVKPYSRIRRGKHERVKGYSPLRTARMTKKLREKAQKLINLAEANKLLNRARSIEGSKEMSLEEARKHLGGEPQLLSRHGGSVWRNTITGEEVAAKK